MADAFIKRKIRDALKDGCFRDPEDFVDVSDGDGSDDDIHVIVVSRKFDGRRMKEKHDLIWSELPKRLNPEEWGKVSLSIGVSPEELKVL